MTATTYQLETIDERGKRRLVGWNMSRADADKRAALSHWMGLATIITPDPEALP